jgi:uncharacterized DUF497 family protein
MRGFFSAGRLDFVAGYHLQPRRPVRKAVVRQRLARVRRSVAEADVCPYNAHVRIEWDPSKAAANLQEHGVSFAEAATVLNDDYALTREDPDSINEQRFVSLGMSATGALLVVIYTHRDPDVYRLISSWKANKPQRKLYEKSRR